MVNYIWSEQTKLLCNTGDDDGGVVANKGCGE
jgi:hypothetical protein